MRTLQPTRRSRASIFSLELTDPPPVRRRVARALATALAVAVLLPAALAAPTLAAGSGPNGNSWSTVSPNGNSWSTVSPDGNSWSAVTQ